LAKTSYRPPKPAQKNENLFFPGANFLIVCILKTIRHIDKKSKNRFLKKSRISYLCAAF
jgi:hypothetical protein